MTTIAGRSERHAERNMDVQVSADDRVGIHIFHPNGRSGASTSVALSELRDALGHTRPTELITLGPGPLYVQRRGIEVYLWIRGVAQNGWSIYVNSEALENALGSTLTGSSRARSQVNAARIISVAGFTMLVGVGIAGACAALG